MNAQAPVPADRERDLFLGASELSTPEERARYLDRECGGDAALRSAVEALLKSDRADAFLETPAVELPSPGQVRKGPSGTVSLDPAPEGPGARIGRYKLLQQIGEGGVGTVYMAEQEEPIRRRVALKVLKPGMDTKSVIARFESERQALAMMDHPNIAKVLDAGALGADGLDAGASPIRAEIQMGRPYFVMELVRGIRITDYCDENQVPTIDRLRLFILVCQAIQHAHQKGIIHRDIKPSNILVTLHDGVPVPKVIDFGIAKAIGQRLTDKTFFTEFRAFIGTPAYMSPEQAEMSGLDIDTRADVYSLGVLLYEMLTGRTPFDAEALVSSGLDGMRRTLREQEPLAPSTRFRTLVDTERTTTASRRRIEPARLASLLRGDLDWIVLKALEKDRTRRYETASALAMDVQRFLDNEPIFARPPSAAYRLQKLVRRNKLICATAGAFGLALVLGLAVSTWQFIDKTRAYHRASQAEQQQSQLREEAEQQRRLAQAQELAARQRAYAADINLVQQALTANNLGRARELLEAQRPATASSVDLRGWDWRYLWQQCQSDALFTLTQLSNAVDTIVASADGRWAALSAGDQGLSLWDLRSRQPIATLPVARSLGGFAFSPVTPLLAYTTLEPPGPGRSPPKLRLWHVEANQSEGELQLPAPCLTIAFSADGSRLFTVTGDGNLITWNPAEKTRASTVAVADLPFVGPTRSGTRAAVSSDLATVAFALPSGAVKVVDAATGAEKWVAQAADEEVKALAFSPDGRLLASGAGYVESSVRLWDVATGAELGRLEGHRTWVSSLVFWPDGETLASGSGDQTIHLWDLSRLRSFSRPNRFAPPPNDRPGPGPRRPPFRPPSLQPYATLRGHELEVWSLALLPDRTTLLSGSKDGTVNAWDVTRLRRDRAAITLPTLVRSWMFARDGAALLALDHAGRVFRCQGDGYQEETAVVEIGTNYFGALFSPSGRYVVASSPRDPLRAWDLTQPSELPAQHVSGAAGLPIAFLPQSEHLILYRFPDRSFSEWDLEAGREVRAWQPDEGLGLRAGSSFSADGRWMASLGDEGSGQLRELATGRVQPLALNFRSISHSAFSPDGRQLAVASTLGTGFVLDTATGQPVAVLRGLLQGMHSITFSPDGRRLATGGNGNEAIRLWDVETARELLTLAGEGSFFSEVAFSPDGNVLAASNRRGRLHLWLAPSFADIDRHEAARP